MEPETVDDALVAASRFADSYLQNRYNTPILSWNEDLTLNTAKLAAWTVLSARGYDPSNPHDVILRTEWEDAVAWLEDVADGRAHLTPPITESPPDGGGPSGFSTTQRIVF